MKRKSIRTKSISEANGEKDAIISKAQGAKIARTEQAQGDVAVFNKMYEQYEGNQQITRERLILETLGKCTTKCATLHYE